MNARLLFLSSATVVLSAGYWASRTSSDASSLTTMGEQPAAHEQGRPARRQRAQVEFLRPETTAEPVSLDAWPPAASDEELKSWVDVPASNGLPAARLQLGELIAQAESRRVAALNALRTLRDRLRHPDGEECIRSTNGQLLSQGTWLDGKRVGRWRLWNDDGHLLEEGRYDTAGNRDGLWTQWTRAESGYMRVEDHYNNGVLNGTHVAYYPSGLRAASGAFDNGMKEGAWTFLHENGALEQSVTYHQGALADGVERRYYDNGQIACEATRRNGVLEGLETCWYPNGQKDQETPYVDGKEDGAVRRWNERGTLVELIEYSGGKPNGAHRLWADNGNLTDECVMASGVVEGWSYHYSATTAGLKLSESLYAHGVAQGVAHVWYDNGARKSDVEWQHGKREGVATNWRKDGTVQSTGRYRADAPDGQWIFYRDDGLTVDHVEHWDSGVHQSVTQTQ